ncbi:MAG: IclR family transcriptional regulator [Syntrophorhabdaceae bacterium]|nr:IclR family transcriptional regulator [Syntrophorhabdaceae bacterium]
MFRNTKFKDKSTRPSNLVQTVERVSQIIDLVGNSSQGMSIKDISSTLGLPKGTVHRLLTSLAYFGYIRQDAKTKNYLLGLKLLELGNLITSQLDLRKIAEPYLKELAEKTKETVHMVILDQYEVVYIEKIESEIGTGGLKMASRVGARNPAHSCAVGKVLLSYLTDEELDTFIEKKGLPQRTPNTIVSPIQLKEHLSMVRNQGYAIDDEENEKGIRCVAAPIFDDKGRPVSAISISGPSFRVTKKLIQDVLKKEVIKTGLEISKALGFKGVT